MYIFDLEEEIMRCWNVVNDVKDAANHIGDHESFKGMSPEHCDAIMNLLMGIQNVYDMRFEKTWKLFEKHCGEYHTARRTIKHLEKQLSRPPEDHDYVEQK